MSQVARSLTIIFGGGEGFEALMEGHVAEADLSKPPLFVDRDCFLVSIEGDLVENAGDDWTPCPSDVTVGSVPMLLIEGCSRDTAWVDEGGGRGEGGSGRWGGRGRRGQGGREG